MESSITALQATGHNVIFVGSSGLSKYQLFADVAQVLDVPSAVLTKYDPAPAPSV